MRDSEKIFFLLVIVIFALLMKKETPNSTSLTTVDDRKEGGSSEAKEDYSAPNGQQSVETPLTTDQENLISIRENNGRNDLNDQSHIEDLYKSIDLLQETLTKILTAQHNLKKEIIQLRVELLANKVQIDEIRNSKFDSKIENKYEEDLSDIIENEEKPGLNHIASVMNQKKIEL